MKDKSGICEICNKEVDKIVGHSINKKICKACYSQFKRTGSFERISFRNKDRKICILCKKEKKIVCKHMCKACYDKTLQAELRELYGIVGKKV